MPTRSMLGIVAIALLAAACSDSGTATPATSTAAATTTAPATTPPTTDPAPSVATTTEVAVMSPPTSTEPDSASSTTTSSAPLDDKAAVLFALDASDRSFDAAVRNPTDADAELALADYHAGDVLEGATALLADYRDRGLAERTNPDEPSRSELLSGPTFIDSDTAELSVCFINSNILVLLTPDGPVDFNDDIISVRQDLRFERFPEGWKLTEANNLAEFDGQVGCDG